MRVVSLPPAPHAAEEAPNEAVAPPALPPEPPAWSWFSIIGTAGDLRAGVSGGERGGTSVWFVREGDRLPGGLDGALHVARPPGVHVEGAVEAALPYSPRPSGASRPRDGVAGDGS